jgi:delta 1-pyrroline-5-carboxylate dehydrogenase
MSELADLAHTVTLARTRAALCRDMGEHEMAAHLERKADLAEREIERLNLLVVQEIGVS